MIPQRITVKPRVLHLTLHRKWFDEIRSGRKKEEYRDGKPYWNARLKEGQPFKEIRFVNGYGEHRPFLRVACEHIYFDHFNQRWVIQLGKILEVGNV